MQQLSLNHSLASLRSQTRSLQKMCFKRALNGWLTTYLPSILEEESKLLKNKSSKQICFTHCWKVHAVNILGTKRHSIFSQCRSNLLFSMRRKTIRLTEEIIQSSWFTINDWDLWTGRRIHIAWPIAWQLSSKKN